MKWSEHLPLALLTLQILLPLKEVPQLPDLITASGSDCVEVGVVCMFGEALIEILFSNPVLYLRPTCPLLLLPSSFGNHLYSLSVCML